MADLADRIRTFPLFSGLSREDVAKILGRLEEKVFNAGTTIFSQGDQGDSFYFIQSGAVQVILEGGGGRRESIAVLGPQDWFGEMALLSGEPRSATIITVKDTTVWRLSREDWNELIEKYPTWLLQYCASLSKRLARIEEQYSQGRYAFNSLAEEFYSSRSPEQQEFSRRVSLLTTIDPQTVDQLLGTQGTSRFVADLEKSEFPLIRALGGNRYELHAFFRDFLREKLLEVEGRETERQLHAQIAAQYEALGEWKQAIHHSLEAQQWSKATQLLIKHQEELLNGSSPFVKNAVERIPPDQFFAEPHLAHIKATALAHVGDLGGAVRIYKEALSQRGAGTMIAEAVARYQSMADTLVQKGEYAQALTFLRSALTLVEQDTGSLAGDADRVTQAASFSTTRTVPFWPNHASLLSLSYKDASVNRWVGGVLGLFASFFSPSHKDSSVSRWVGGVLGLAVWSYLWFWTPDIGLEPGATKLLGLLSLTLIYWVFWVFPDYGVALIFALGLILSRLGKPEVVLGGFASTTWFMTLGVLGLGAAITGSGLFYRLSLQLVRFFPLNYYGQIVALGFMGIVVMALIPQQSARTAIISQMLVNLSESLGYKNPSKASTGLFVASF